MKTIFFLAALCVYASLMGATEADKLQVGFYYEGLCPYCAMYVDDYLLPMSEEGIMDYVDLTMVPAGNYYVNETTGEVDCQHGPDECYLNKFLNCALSKTESQKQAIAFVACIEKVKMKMFKKPKLAKKCAESEGVDYDTIHTCATGEEGNELFAKAMAMTEHLEVPHEWVPWVVVNGIPLYDAMGYLRSVICITMPKDARPAECYKNPGADDDSDEPAAEVTNMPAKRFMRMSQVA